MCCIFASLLSILIYFGEFTILMYKKFSLKIMILIKYTKLICFLAVISLFLNGCNGNKFPGADARKFPADPKKRVEKNLKEGRGFKLSEEFGKNRGGVFDFASSNSLWRASLDVVDFMPLSSVDAVSGVIITDWYGGSDNPNERCKLNIFIKGKELKTNNLKVKSFCQQLRDGAWLTIDNSADKDRQIENAILNRAKKIKLSLN